MNDYVSLLWCAVSENSVVIALLEMLSTRNNLYSFPSSSSYSSSSRKKIESLLFLVEISENEEVWDIKATTLWFTVPVVIVFQKEKKYIYI